MVIALEDLIAPYVSEKVEVPYETVDRYTCRVVAKRLSLRLSTFRLREGRLHIASIGIIESKAHQERASICTALIRTYPIFCETLLSCQYLVSIFLHIPDLRKSCTLHSRTKVLWKRLELSHGPHLWCLSSLNCDYNVCLQSVLQLKRLSTFNTPFQ